MRKFKVVIVDDDDDWTPIIENLVKSDTIFELLPSIETPEEAVEKIPKLKPDLVIMDYLMPGMDGLEVVRTLIDKVDIKTVFFTQEKKQREIIHDPKLHIYACIRKDAANYEDDLLTALKAAANVIERELSGGEPPFELFITKTNPELLYRNEILYFEKAAIPKTAGKSPKKNKLISIYTIKGETYQTKAYSFNGLLEALNKKSAEFIEIRGKQKPAAIHRNGIKDYRRKKGVVTLTNGKELDYSKKGLKNISASLNRTKVSSNGS